MPERRFDIVLFGATGFTGRLTADYLARHAPAGCRWALAGRNQAKLEAVRAELSAIDGALAQLPLLSADTGDPASLAAVAASSRVVISTVGPYLRHGEPLVAACAEAGTDYLDLTGEPEFVDLMYARHHQQATRSGARLIHCCGFDSIPHDLGVFFTVGLLPDDVAITVDGVVRAGGRPSAGTVHSAVTAFSRVRGSAEAARARRQVEPRPQDRRARAARTAPRRVDGMWLLPLPTIDPQVVARSGRALARYGPDFTYHHYAGVRKLPVAVGSVAGMATLMGLAQLPPARRLLLSHFSSGTGPSERQRSASWFKVRFTATGGGHRVVTQVSGGDPGYDETAKMLAESALCVAFDDLPVTAGQVTTAVAMGQPLIQRLTRAGLRFAVLEQSVR
ncbi:MAG TPA: saccharopine dehydrogenase NADP-binding domain-containing protein [Jatrophihabitans sp.]|jgi:saccharopine dehydrogenase (NAD+, L-glutamate forming)|uniref:saccharopine dehydrogenase family protein n=1 Tax=Jatrophihabitans sp. TaxID=1932789 RepID=UPI002F199163